MGIMFFYAIILGIVEGLTEFLPVSSTGHLIIAGQLLGFSDTPGKVFEISIQLGAILAVCWLYQKKLTDTALSIMSSSASQRFALNIFLAFLPAAVLGLLFHKVITDVLFNVWVVATTMVLGGFAIIAIEKWKPSPRLFALDEITPLKALLIGICQSLAMIPGVSRSGATIMGAMCLGIERKTSAEFSFFLAIPTLFAATLYDLYKNYDQLTLNGITLIAAGFVTAFISALLVIRWFIPFISRHGFVPFAWYRIIVGMLLFVMLLS